MKHDREAKITEKIGSVVVLPVDGSAEAERGIFLARALVPPDGELILVQVVHEPQTSVPRWVREGKANTETRSTARELAQQYLASIEAELRAEGVPVRTDVRFGDAAEEIIRLAETEQAELVVMTTQGRGGAGRAIFGSVADRIARHGTRPTLLLRVGALQAIPDRIVVPLDTSSAAEAALSTAASMANRLGADVHLVHVIDLDEILREIRLGRHEDMFELPKDDAFNEAKVHCTHAAEEYLAEQASGLQAVDVTVTTEVKTGTPAFVLLDLLRPGDLGVMTTRGLGGVQRLWLGSVAEKLVREASAPILIIPPARTAAAEATPGA